VSLALGCCNGRASRVEIATGTSDDRLGIDAAGVAEATLQMTVIAGFRSELN
jgi:hypothetical protein